MWMDMHTPRGSSVSGSHDPGLPTRSQGLRPQGPHPRPLLSVLGFVRVAHPPWLPNAEILVPTTKR